MTYTFPFVTNDSIEDTSSKEVTSELKVDTTIEPHPVQLSSQRRKTPTLTEICMISPIKSAIVIAGLGLIM